MPRCPSCRESIRGPRERIGARCPYCHEPLYERSNPPERVEERDTASNRCAVHPDNLARTTCQRCGNFICGVCRTRWRGRTVCAACVERLLEERETTPEEVRAHFRQALLALLFGVLGWASTLFAGVLFAVGIGSSGKPDVALVGLGTLLFLGSPLFALVGIGQGAAAIRTRGDHMIMATCGLLLAGLQVGMTIGLFAFSAWQS